MSKACSEHPDAVSTRVAVFERNNPAQHVICASLPQTLRSRMEKSDSCGYHAQNRRSLHGNEKYLSIKNRQRIEYQSYTCPFRMSPRDLVACLVRGLSYSSEKLHLSLPQQLVHVYGFLSKTTWNQPAGNSTIHCCRTKPNMRRKIHDWQDPQQMFTSARHPQPWLSPSAFRPARSLPLPPPPAPPPPTRPLPCAATHRT